MQARKAQVSAERMEKVNGSMHEIAKKTQQETVSMKIITLVTLFFLPGTFISVRFFYNSFYTSTTSDRLANRKISCLKTIMSTDILKFQDNSKNFQSKALIYYLIITIPIMIITFGAWWVMYVWVKRGEEKKAYQRQQGSLSSLENGASQYLMGNRVKF